MDDGRKKYLIDQGAIRISITILATLLITFFITRHITRPKCFTLPKQLNQQLKVDRLYVTSYTFTTDLPVCQ